MAELDELERRLALAQVGLAAPPGVRERVRAKLGTVAVPPAASSEMTISAAAGHRPLLKAGLSSGASWVARRGVPTWGALALTGLGFAAGYLFGHRSSPAANEPTMQASALHTESGSASALHGESLRGYAKLAAEAPPSIEAVLAPSARADGASIAARDQIEMGPNGGLETESNGSRVTPAHTKARATRRSAPSDGLAAELALLQRAERAIRASNADLAVALLDQLDREHPKPQLVQEREAARLLADCERSAPRAVGNAAPSAATEHARQYLSVHSASVYSERIRNLCRIDAAAASASANTVPAAEPQPPAPNGAEGSPLRGR